MLKNNWELDKEKIQSLSMYHDTLPTDIFDWLKNKSFEARENSCHANMSLVGHIRQEYFIKSVKDDIEDLKVDNDPMYLIFQNWLSNRCFEKPVSMFDESNFILNDNRPMVISSLWVNFQKKYEFNPPHIHGGLYSFIIFVNVPYELEDEMKCFATNQDSLASKLYFLSPVPLNFNRSGITRVEMNVDKSYEGKMILFPAHLQHGVFPFYTSDDHRITISGNLVFDV